VGNLRACATGCTISAIGGFTIPFIDDANIALAVCAVNGGFHNFLTVLGLATIAEMTPNRLRARMTAVFLLSIGLMSASIGPLLVGMISDALGGNPNGLGIGLAVVS